MTHQDTGKFRQNEKDQFYTKENVAKKCIDTLVTLFPQVKKFKWIEPSAGEGVFLHNIPTKFDKIGLDIEPKAADILLANFLEWEPPQFEKIVLIGNPPFGKQSSLAKSFIKKGCQFAEIIAFILPKSFVKPSMNRVFDRKFHCQYTEQLEANAFIINGREHNVPCVFQIWVKSELDREIAPKIEAVGYHYVNSDKQYDIVIRRVGVNAGKSFLQGTFSPQSHYFLKVEEQYKDFLDKIVQRINMHEFPSNTVGPRSLSKSEVNDVINKILAIF